MGVTDIVRRGRDLLRSDPNISVDEWSNFFAFGGLGYQLMPNLGYTLGFKDEAPRPTFEGYALSMFHGNSVVHAIMSVRMLLFSEVSFKFQNMASGRPGKLYGNASLEQLEHPWPNGTTADLLARAIQDVDLSGNFYCVRRGRRLYRARPDWMTIVLGSQMEPEDPGFGLDAEVVGYLYKPGGPAARLDPIPLNVQDVAHWAPDPDPLAHYRGVSWLTSAIREVMADSAATQHKLMFFENGATPNMAISLDPTIQIEAYKKWKEVFERDQEGTLNAYKTLFLGGGSTLQVVGANMRQIDFKVTQGAGETRLAASAGVPPIIVGLSEGLASATYSNYELAMRRFTDLTMRPLWGSMASAMTPLVKVPSKSRLWYDDRDIPALADDQKKSAEIQTENANAIHTLIIAGYKPDAAVQAVLSGDLGTLVGNHTDLFSVQLQPAGSVGEGKGSLVEGVPVQETNGSGDVAQAAALLKNYLERRR